MLLILGIIYAVSLIVALIELVNSNKEVDDLCKDKVGFWGLFKMDKGDAIMVFVPLVNTFVVLTLAWIRITNWIHDIGWKKILGYIIHPGILLMAAIGSYILCFGFIKGILLLAIVTVIMVTLSIIVFIMGSLASKLKQ